MNKYITITNKSQYLNNKNGEFTADIYDLELNDKYKVAISEFIYTNKIKIYNGIVELKLITHTNETDEYINHKKKYKYFNQKVCSFNVNLLWYYQ